MLSYILRFHIWLWLINYPWSSASTHNVELLFFSPPFLKCAVLSCYLTRFLGHFIHYSSASLGNRHVPVSTHLTECLQGWPSVISDSRLIKAGGQPPPSVYLPLLMLFLLLPLFLHWKWKKGKGSKRKWKGEWQHFSPLSSALFPLPIQIQESMRSRDDKSTEKGWQHLALTPQMLGGLGLALGAFMSGNSDIYPTTHSLQIWCLYFESNMAFHGSFLVFR